MKVMSEFLPMRSGLIRADWTCQVKLLDLALSYRIETWKFVNVVEESYALKLLLTMAFGIWTLSMAGNCMYVVRTVYLFHGQKRQDLDQAVTTALPCRYYCGCVS